MLALTFDLGAAWSLVGKLHPILVHFPVALITVAGLLEAWAWKKGEAHSREGMVCLRIGALAAVASAISGWSFATGHDPDDTLFLHRWGGIALAVVAVLATALARGGFPGRGYRPLAIALVPAVGFIGHLGGELSWGKGYIQNAVLAVFTAPEEPTGTGPGTDPATDGPATTDLSTLSPEERHFVESVWPIFRDTCIECHGDRKQKGDLRLDRRADALAAESIVAGDPDASDIVWLIETDFEEERMPPPEEGPPLSAEKIAAIRLWVRDGAAWPEIPLPAAGR